MPLNCCILCPSTEIDKILYEFPARDNPQFQKWATICNPNKLNAKNNFVCENHFRVKDFLFDSGYRVLAADAVPLICQTVSEISLDACRFCLEIPMEQIVIDDLVRRCFDELTQMKLETSSNLPSTCCPTCYDQIKASAHFKHRIQKVQEQITDIQNSQLIKEEFLDSITEVDCEINVKMEDQIPMKLKSRIRSRAEVKPKKLVPENQQVEEKLMKCGVCGTGQFASRKELNRHVKENHLDSDFEDDPEPTRQSLSKFNNHFKCQECQKLFASVESLRRHCIVYHSTDEARRERILDQEKNRKEMLAQKVECLVCKKMISKRHLTAHHKRNHDVNARKLICDFCGKRQFNKQDMASHMEMNHTTREAISCPYCEFTSDLQKYIKDHIRARHLNKGIVCEICGQTVVNRYKLKNHLRVWHTKEKPYKCKIDGCNLYFVNTTTRGQHIKKDHMLEVSTCPICGKEFQNKVSLMRHQSSIHKEKTISCTFDGCDRKFGSNSKLQVHLASHTGLKPFCCRHCPHQSAMKAGLLRHLRDVHLNLKISCEICDFTTGRKELYRKHVLKNHRDIEEGRFNDLLKRIREMPLPKIDLDM